MKPHICSWEPIGDSRLVCHGCNLVTSISVLLQKARVEAAQQAKIKLLSDQLFGRELKKDAHDKYYAWVRANTSAGSVVLPGARQEQLL